MSEYHFSFGVEYGPRRPHPAYPNADGRGYATITADDETQARRAALALFGRWCVMHCGGPLVPDFWPLGELQRFDAATVLGATR